MSSEVPDAAKIERYKAIGADAALVKPLTMSDLMRYFKRIKYNMGEFT